jgi:hypothetical protein
MWSVLRCYKGPTGVRGRVVRESVKRRLGVVEEPPLLEAVTREQLVKTQQTEMT